ncbi:hypothetical protein CDD82_6200 [Ophiocordyceps australis]|uniref:Dehydrogenase FUB6 n=1 Tax=Ophiocordyceps australis TaxID=1399860 RepID=A0A2C5YR80_9HYPO|nr:hypothetical protein CDD82_6200 [Ophiocordyceps australis]
MAQNTEVVLRERPTAEFVVGKTFEYTKSPMPQPAHVKDGQILIEALYLSLDPAMRGWVSGELCPRPSLASRSTDFCFLAQQQDRRSYSKPVQIGERMRGAVIARVLFSKSKQAATGDLVTAFSGWAQYAIVSDGAFEPASNFPPVQEPTDMFSYYGMTAMTAWVGMAHIGQPEPGNTVVVSGAAGATGSIAGQIAKAKGAYVVGICGSDDKCKWLRDELAFDVAINYKASDFKEQLIKATPNYIDVYYDNVGGEILDLCLGRAKEFARYVECGMISTYNSSTPVSLKNLGSVVAMRIKLQGFIVTDHMKLYPQARKEIAQWTADGKIKAKETIVKGGIEAADQALVDLYKGANTGKLIVEIKNPKEAPSKL